ncbi:unnamed protein product [Heligmosomoides polygyrus]|uniref:Tyrosine-protein phosphatase domain-containing protein n=1 Tax=Heligmosomoides polygyrus TaxID=6339 RepID=A0A183G842_HELPZ|nr:unnamed protein product [Heligmosomoides polygyrus]
MREISCRNSNSYNTKRLDFLEDKVPQKRTKKEIDKSAPSKDSYTLFEQPGYVVEQLEEAPALPSAPRIVVLGTDLQKPNYTS